MIFESLTLTLTQIAKVILEGDAHITRVLGMGIPKTRGCPYHCNTPGSLEQAIHCVYPLNQSRHVIYLCYAFDIG